MDALTMGSVVRRSAAQYPHRTAFIFGEERCTYAAYNQRVNRAAHMLLGLKIDKGDHIAILGRNSIRYLESCHAAAKVGAVFGPINWRLAAPEIAFIIKDGDNKVLLIEHGFQDLVASIREELSDVTLVVYGGKTTLEGAYQFEDLAADAPDGEPGIEVAGDDPAVVMYTSGTTGLPKGAVLTHSNVCWDSIAALTYLTPGPSDCFLLSMPMNHVSGLHTQTTTFLARGLPIVIMPQWEPEEACRLIERHRVTMAYILVTPLYQLMASKAYERYDLTSLCRVSTAAATYTPEFTAEVMAGLGIEGIYFFYGLSEASPIVSATEISAQMIAKPNTMGFPVWYVDVEIFDDNDQPLPRGEIGEIVVRGPNVFSGYYKRPEANAEVLRGGWLHTGDIGYLDDDNFIFFVDRKKDMIKSGGMNVYSLEVEQGVAKAVPEISEVAVVGLPDDAWGEAVIAFVVLKAGAELTEADIIAAARAHLGGYKLPKKIVFRTELPKNVSGKVLKRRLREEFMSSADAAGKGA